MSDRPLLVGLTVASGLMAYKLYKGKQGYELGLPPSPRSYPLLGHLLSIPNEYEHLGFMRLGEQLGSRIFLLSAFGTTMIVLNDRDDATNLFDKRSTTYSDRTCPPMVQDPSLLNWSNFGSLVGYGDRWRKYRRLMTPWLNKQAVVAYHESQEHATKKLLHRLLNTHEDVKTSHDLEAELYLCISATMLRSLYGYEAESSSDPFLVRSREAFSYLAQAMLASNYLVNTLPALRHIPKWFPGANWKRNVSNQREEKDSLIDELYNIALEKTKKDENTRLMVASLRGQALKLGLTEEEADDYVKQISITMFAGGTDTSVSTLMMFFMAILIYPEVQRKAQAELDSVIGADRLPSFQDRPRLGYIERIVQETLRWGPITPLALPHTCFQDDTYKGYRIPKGTIVAMTRDEKVYPNPEVFDPDRYLDLSTPLSPVFGWGRRRCPGTHFAEASLFIAIASILLTFNVEVAQDNDGKDVPPTGKLVNSLVLVPEKFMVKLTPRSTKHAELIRHSL
ncbi:unnamed protein product [Rhizoctonia solani]|uniref:O-methylsterigmatocystin oxidoreductase n=1 Tax=Rhizoctonia solani TaxID=456999 RepID=A0A8H2ZUV1_9AGAM|nr:unnamed protein product [Rhizoctonia solani]